MMYAEGKNPSPYVGWRDMADAGQVIVNLLTGERITILQVARATDDSILQAEVSVEPQKAILPLHIHARSEERWAVEAGRLGARVGAELLTLGVGERAVVSTGVPHTWWNEGPEEVRFRLDVVRPLKMEEAFAPLAGMARDGKVLVLHGRCIPILIVDLALLLCATDSYVAEPPIPLWLQKIAYRGIVAVAHRLGYQPRYAL